MFMANLLLMSVRPGKASLKIEGRKHRWHLQSWQYRRFNARRETV